MLPYRTVRESSDPDGLLLAFLRAAFAAGAETGDWPQVAAGGDGRVAAADPEVLS